MIIRCPGFLVCEKKMGANSYMSLDEFHQKIFHGHIPIIIVLSVLSVVGIIGNTVTLVYYRIRGTKKTVNFLIASLAGIDLLVCAVLIVGITDIAYNVKFSSATLCKTAYFFIYGLIFISILILSLICIDRYRKICSPFNSQMSRTFAKRSVVFLCITAFTFASRAFVTYDVVKVEIGNASINNSIFAYQCETSDDPALEVVVRFFHYLDIVIIGIIFLVFVVTYTLVLRSLYLHVASMKAMGRSFALSSQVHHVKTTESYPKKERIKSEDEKMKVVHCEKSKESSIITGVANGSTAIAGNSKASDATTDITINRIVNNNSDGETVTMSRNKDTDDTEPDSSRVVVLKKVEIQTTIMMVIVTVWFTLCFSLYFGSIEQADVFPIASVAHLMQKCSFLNSVLNPAIYYMFNYDFRQFINNLFAGCSFRAS